MVIIIWSCFSLCFIVWCQSNASTKITYCQGFEEITNVNAIKLNFDFDLIMFYNFSALFMSMPITSLMSIITSLTGLVIYANFWKCDPIIDKHITSKDQLVPYYVIKSLSQYPGLSGLFVAGIFSGSLSSVSSFVNSLAAVTLEDYVKPYFFKGKIVNEKTSAKISKSLALLFGLLGVTLTYPIEQMAGLLQASLTIFGVVGGPLLLLFTLGMCCCWCNSKGALIGFFTSLFISLWIGFGSLFYVKPPSPLPLSTEECIYTTNLTVKSTGNDDVFFIYKISYLWYGGFSLAIGLIVALIISYLTGGTKEVVNDDLLAPCIRRKTQREPNLISLSQRI